MILDLLRSLPKTIILNFKCFEPKVAIKLPIIVSHRVHIKGLHRRSIILESSTIKTGMIRMGFSHGAFERGRYRKSYLSVSSGGGILFKGSAHIAHDFVMNVSDSGKIVLGNNFASGSGLIISCENRIEFGKDVLLGWDCTLIDGDGHDILNKNQIKINESRPISIGEHVWVAAKVSVLKGSLIPDNAVIGYGSVVTGKFENENVIISGYPAKENKRDISWQH